MTHRCVDCRALPEAERPPRPRPIAGGGPRSARCDTHWRAVRKARKAAQRVTRVTRVYGLTPAEQAALWAFQGQRCPCGRQPTRGPDTDHDHRCCDGPTSCGQCVRGLLCRACNREVIGRYSAAQLRALAEYIEDPPMARLRRQRGTELEEAS